MVKRPSINCPHPSPGERRLAPVEELPHGGGRAGGGRGAPRVSRTEGRRPPRRPLLPTGRGEGAPSGSPRTHLGEPRLLLPVPLVGSPIGRVHVGEGVRIALAAGLGLVLLLELQLPVELLVPVLSAHPGLLGGPRRERGGTTRTGPKHSRRRRRRLGRPLVPPLSAAGPGSARARAAGSGERAGGRARTP